MRSYILSFFVFVPVLAICQAGFFSVTSDKIGTYMEAQAGHAQKIVDGLSIEATAGYRMYLTQSVDFDCYCNPIDLQESGFIGRVALMGEHRLDNNSSLFLTLGHSVFHRPSPFYTLGLNLRWVRFEGGQSRDGLFARMSVYLR